MIDAWRRPAWLVLPLALFLCLFYFIPVILMLWRSAGPHYDFTPFAQAVTSPIVWRIFAQTAQLAAASAFLTMLMGFPCALFIASARPLVARVLLALVMLPFWTSILIRSYAWMALLGRQGVINQALIWFGFIHEPVRLLNTSFAVYVGMIHILLPFMILPIYGSLKSLDGRLIAAAENLGAGSFAVLRYIILPLSMPGIFAGVVLVFVLALGFYITPTLLGGPRDLTIATMIAEQVDLYAWDFASALATLLLVLTFATLLVASRLIRFERVLGGLR